MKQFIQGLFDAQRHRFHKGGDLEWAYPLFEFPEVFLLTPGDKTQQGAHVRDPADHKRLMMVVIYALIPATVWGMYNVGAQAFLAEGHPGGVVESLIRGAIAMLPIIITSYAVGGVWELLFSVVRKHEINEGFLVTGLLFPLTLAPTTPLWIVAVAVSFGVVIGKEVFGGTGMNILNPALTGRAFVFFSYPAAISGAKVWDVADKALVNVDTYTGATPLLAVAGSSKPPIEALAAQGWTWWDLFIGNIPGSMGEVSAAAALVGAAVLILSGVGSWRIMVGCVAGLSATAFMFNGLAGESTNMMMHLPASYHLVMGGFAFGAVFMATDPVSAAITPVGRLIYGFLIGVMAALVRVVNPAFPEGMMLAILFLNVFAPLIDYFAIKGGRSRRIARMASV